MSGSASKRGSILGASTIPKTGENDGVHMEFGSTDDAELKEAELAEKLRLKELQDIYTKKQKERELGTFSMTMRMTSSALANIRKEFFVREDEVNLEEFIYIIQKHVVTAESTEEETKELMANMTELFKEIDVNGDGMMEWSEFTQFTVEKANVLNRRMKSSSETNYFDSTDRLDISSQRRHKNDFSNACPIKSLNQFAILEEAKNAIYIYSSVNGKLIKTINTYAVPQAILHVSKHDLLVSACADMTIQTHSLDDPNPNKRYQLRSHWSTPGIQMALAFVEKKDVLYSGGANGNIFAWDIKQRTLLATINAHSDIVMKLLVLKNLNTLVSASLDTTIGIWDVYTHTQIMKLQGHKKGVFSVDYNPEYRLLFSCGFDRDICVWSPFVNSMIYRLKGHHSTLIGCQCIEGTSELITADTAGVFKLWDVRRFQCMQTFFACNYHGEISEPVHLNTFFHVDIPATNPLQQNNSRIFAASKTIHTFDKSKVSHGTNTDFASVIFVDWNHENSQIYTCSMSNFMIWDAVNGTRSSVQMNVCGSDITAVCMDNRKRKLLVGDATGRVGIYNPLNGALMKSIHHEIHTPVVSIVYITVNENRRFLVGFASGEVRLYDEGSLEDCGIVQVFDPHRTMTDLAFLSCSESDRSVSCVPSIYHTITCFDLDTGKHDGEFLACNETDHIVFTCYLNPFPLILTCDSIGNICIWGGRTSKWPKARLAGFMNINPPSSEMEPKSNVFDTEFDEPNRRVFPLKEESYENFVRNNQVAQNISDIFQYGPAGSGHFSRAPKPMFSFSTKSDGKVAGHPSMGSKKPAIPSLNMPDDSAHTKSNVEALKFSPGLFNPFSPAVAQSGPLSSHEPENKENDYFCSQLAKDYLKEAEHLWGKISPANAASWYPEKHWLYVGDELGFLRKFDLTLLLEELGLLKGNGNFKDELKKVPRNSSCALSLVLNDSSTLVGKKYGVSHMGVDFVWGVSACNDRIVYMCCNEYGVVTSATDQIVRMWTHEGIAIGALYQHIPMGMKSSLWDLNFDIEGIICKENEALDELMLRVGETAKNPDKPTIDNADFAGMEPGRGAAEFNRSELRQRIHKTSKILGLNFIVEEDLPMLGGIEDNSMLLSSASLNDASSILSSTATESVTSSCISKTLQQAMHELRCTDNLLAKASAKQHFISSMQLRRKKMKMAEVAKKFEANKAYKLPPINLK